MAFSEWVPCPGREDFPASAGSPVPCVNVLQDYAEGVWHVLLMVSLVAVLGVLKLTPDFDMGRTLTYRTAAWRHSKVVHSLLGHSEVTVHETQQVRLLGG